MVVAWGFSDSHLSVEAGIQDWGITWLPSAGFCSREAQPGRTEMSLLGQLLHEAGMLASAVGQPVTLDEYRQETRKSLTRVILWQDST